MHRAMGETFRKFMQCMAWAKAGKTFLYVHPDFVAMDTETYLTLQERHSIPRSAYIDEAGDWTPEVAAELSKILKRK